jgi:polar amino acid transport system substrate-binding protein
MRTRVVQTLTLAIAVFAFSSGVAVAETNFERIKKEGVVRLGFQNEAPFTFTQPDGSLAGEDYELAGLVFERLGVRKIEPVLTEFASLIPGLKARRIDVVATALFIRKARCAQVLFSEPNLTLSDAVIVRAGNPKKIHSYADVAKDKSIKVTATVGAVHVKNALANGVPQDQIMEVPNITNSLAALKGGRSDGMLQNTIFARWLVKSSNDPMIEVAQPFEAPLIDGKPQKDYAAFAFNLEDTDLRDAFNAELVKVLHTPPHLAILSKYGLTDSDAPKDVKTVDICNR